MLTVISVIKNIAPAPAAKYHHAIDVLYANEPNQELPTTQINGTPINIANNTNIVNSEESNRIMLNDDAPKTFRMLISFILRSTVNAINPYNPRHEINIASPANICDNTDTFCCLTYNAL